MELRNDDIRVAEADVTDSEIEMGPDGEQTVETVKVVTLRFADGREPYARWNWGNMLSLAAEPTAQLLCVEWVSCQYRYDHEFRTWWASSFDLHTVHADEDGRKAAPQREQFMSFWGETSHQTPQWVKTLVEEYRPAPDDAPPPPRKKALC